MADIIAHDLSALIPEDATQIAANLDTLKRELLELRSAYQDRLIELDDDVVFALTGDSGLLVDGALAADGLQQVLAGKLETLYSALGR